MEDIGRRLRERREELGFSLRDVQKETKIRTKWLQALEEGNQDTFPAVVYMKGFLRSYADALGLDGAGMVRELMEDEDQGGREKPKDEGDKPRDSSSRHRSDRPMDTGRLAELFDKSPRRPSMLPVFLVILALVVAGVWWLWQEGADIGTEDPDEEVAENQSPQDDPDPGPGDDEPEPDPDPVVELERLSPTQALITVREADQLAVDLRTTGGQRCWVRVTVDGELVAEETLGPGSVRTVQGNSEILVRAGNPPGLILTVNDEELGPLEADNPVNIRIVREPTG